MKFIVFALVVCSLVLATLVAADLDNAVEDRVGCPKILAPVCGNDQQIYSNACVAEANEKVKWARYFIPPKNIALGWAEK